MTARLPAPLALALAFVFGALPALAADVGDTATSREGDADRVDAWLPGRVAASVVLEDDRGPAIWLFVPDAGPAKNAGPLPPERDPCAGATVASGGELWRFAPHAGGASIERVLSGLPTLPTTLATVDLDGDGKQALIAISRAGIARWSTTPGARPEWLVEGDDVDPRTTYLSRFAGQADPLLVVSDLGEARFGRLRGPALESMRTVELPVDAVYRRDEFRLSTRPLLPIGTYAGVPAYADRPAAVGKQRLTGRLVRPTLEDDVVVEWWARLPEPEELLEARYITVGDEPALLVTTRPAFKLNLFGEKRLRLYRLEADRSQTGHPPFFAVETRANLWQSIVPYLRDVDGDGRADLVLAYWKGLTDSRIVLDAYLADAAGAFGSNPRTTGFDVKKGERSFVSWERDVTGDGEVDLLVIGRGRLRVHAGVARAKKGRDLVESKPAHEVLVIDGAEGDEEVEVDVELGGGGMQFEGERLSSGGARLVDLDGDGVWEALFMVPDEGRWKVSVVRFSAGR